MLKIPDVEILAVRLFTVCFSCLMATNGANVYGSRVDKFERIWSV